jgi:hypothetical protein
MSHEFSIFSNKKNTFLKVQTTVMSYEHLARDIFIIKDFILLY